MAKVWFVLCLSLILISATLPKPVADISPTFPTVAGVFLFSRGPYAFNASSARTACESLGLTIATKSQLISAHEHGLETCRYGWLDERIAVIIRITPNAKCGQNNTGIITWRASLDKLFDVFCFNASDIVTYPTNPTIQDTMTTEATVGGTSPQNTESPLVDSTSTTDTRAPPKAQTSPASLTRTASIPSTTHDTQHQPQDQPQPAFGALPFALGIVAVLLILLTVSAAFWYFKMHRKTHPLSNKDHPKENIETEIWKQNNCEAECKEHQPETDIDGSRNNSKDTNLLPGPETKQQ